MSLLLTKLHTPFNCVLSPPQALHLQTLSQSGQLYHYPVLG